MKKFKGMFLLAVLLASNAMAEKVDSKGKACGSVKGIQNCASGCWEDGNRLTPDKCRNSFKGSVESAPAKGVERGHSPKKLYE